MEITKTYDWNRRDFRFDAKCEHCGHVTTKNTGYDDSNFYNNVLPDKECPNCKESSNSKERTDGTPKTVVVPKYPENLTL